MTSAAALDAALRPTTGIWLLLYGPCWCRTTPTESGSFDYVRLRRTVENPLDENLLIVSNRVVDGSAQVYRQTYEEVPSPKLVVAAATCPSASRFWEGLPNGWSPVAEILPIDIEVEECVSGYPESLLTAVLGHVLSRDDSESGRGQGSEEDGWVVDKASSDA